MGSRATNSKPAKRRKNGIIQINIYALNGRDFLKITFATDNNNSNNDDDEEEDEDVRQSERNEKVEENRYLFHLSHFKKRFRLQIPWIMFGKRERAHG